MFEYQQNPRLDPAALAELFARVGWEEPDPGRKLEWMVAASEEWVTCTVEGELIGFGRTFRLDPARKVVFDVVVDERFEGFGVDDEIIRRLAGFSGTQEVEIFRQEDPIHQGSSECGSEVDYWVPEAPPGAYLG